MIEPHNISSLFFKAANQNSDNLAIIADASSINYYELRVEVERTAAYFLECGIKSGDRVLVFVPMSIDLYRIVLALFSIGATAVFLDEWVSLKRLKLCTEMAQCTGFIGVTKAHLLRLFSKSIRRIPIKLRIGGRSTDLKQVPIKVDPHLPALITFTTGSTGKPKAAVRTHQFLQTQFEILQHKVGTKSTDVEITNLPIVLFINLGIGATTVICNFSPKKVHKFNFANLVRKIDSNHVSRIVFSPYLLHEYCKHLDSQKRTNKSIKQIFTGGGPVFPNEAKLVNRIFPEIQSEVIFGSTEAEPISSISMKTLSQRTIQLDKGLAVGKPHPEAEIKIIEILDRPVSTVRELAKNQVGEIIVAGRHVLANYLHNPEAFERNKILVDPNIYHRTGDSGFLNDHDELFLTGRCNAIIQSKDKTYFPFLVENVLNQLRGVKLGTLVQLGGQLILAVEHSEDGIVSKASCENTIRANGFEGIKIIWTKIPRDPRHHTKIDVDKLKMQLLKVI